MPMPHRVSFYGIVLALLLADCRTSLAEPGAGQQAAQKQPTRATGAPASDKTDSGDIFPLSLRGTVVDSEGHAVSGADVWLLGPSHTRSATKIYGQRTSDKAGRFQFDVPRRWFRALTQIRDKERAIVAWKSGTQLAALPIEEAVIPPEDDIRLTLQPEKRAAIRIQGPEGTPIVGVQVLPRQLAGGESGQTASVSLPEKLARRFAVHTDASGTAVLKAFPLEQVDWLTVESSKFGAQRLHKPDASWPRAIELAPAGRLVGRIVAEDAKLVSGLPIRVMTYGFDPSGTIVRIARTEVTTDRTGRFEVPRIAEGALVTHVQMPPDVPYRARTTQSKQELLMDATDWAVRGELTEVEIPLKRAVKITGVVREAGTGHPISGLLVHFQHAGSWFDFVETDSQGRYTCFALPSHDHIRPPDLFVPLEFLIPQPINNLRPLNVPVGAKTLEVPPLELSRAIIVRGQVIDASQRPVAEALVRARWADRSQGNTAGVVDTSVRTDERGRFSIFRVDPRTSRLRFIAERGEAVLEKALTLQQAPSQLVTLEISPEHRIALSGRVVDPFGKPLAGATVEIWHRPADNRERVERVRFDEDRPIVTDKTGQFQTPRQLVRWRPYRAIVRGPGIREASTDWLWVELRERTDFPELVVKRLGVREGMVRDQQGRPVDGAHVRLLNDRQTIEAVTDSAGRFRFDSAPDGRAFLLVEKDGFRLQGQLSASSDQESAITLTRLNEKPQQAMRTLPPPLPREKRLQLAREILKPILEAAQSKNEQDRVRPLEVLALIDPQRVLQEIEQQPFQQPFINDYLRRAVLKFYAHDHPDEAIAVAESMQEAMWRSLGYCDICNALPDSQRDRKLKLLAEALLHARNVENPAFRVIALGQIAERLLDLGEKERATQLLREGETIASELPTAAFAGYARGAFAEELAQIDLDAALELTKDLKEKFAFQRHHGNIAHELAAKNPADAQRILEMIRDAESSYSPYDLRAVRICYRMAAVDLERARQIADRIGDRRQRAYVHGIMAWKLAESQPDVAERLLREAFTILQETAPDGDKQQLSPFSIASVAGPLLSVAERINPHLVPEFFWRAVSFRMPVAQFDPTDLTVSSQRNAVMQANATLALFLARYDRETAETVWSLAGEEFATTSRNERSHLALAAIDPQRASRLLQELPLESNETRLRLRVARMLALEGEEVWHEAHRRIGLWYPDVEDIDAP